MKLSSLLELPLLFCPIQCTLLRTLLSNFSKDVYTQSRREVHALMLFQGLDSLECIVWKDEI